MKTTVVTLIVMLALAVVEAHAKQEESTVFDKVHWQRGPSVGNLGDIAEVRVPAGYVFAEANDTRLLMEAMQNPTNGTELGFLAPATFAWFMIFEFDDIGYVRDDEKGSLDTDAMLESIKKGTEAANKERRQRGWPVMTILGWEQKPYYNESTHNLEWAIRGKSEDDLVTNYNTRLLGRGGVMRVTLVTDPSSLSPTLPKYKTALDSFSFKSDHRYTEYRQGDKLSKYGLSALVVGGATAVAVKSGAAKYIWKLLVLVGVGAAAGLRRLFGRRAT